MFFVLILPYSRIKQHRNPVNLISFNHQSISAFFLPIVILQHVLSLPPSSQKIPPNRASHLLRRPHRYTFNLVPVQFKRNLASFILIYQCRLLDIFLFHDFPTLDIFFRSFKGTFLELGFEELQEGFILNLQQKILIFDADCIAWN